MLAAVLGPGPGPSIASANEHVPLGAAEPEPDPEEPEGGSGGSRITLRPSELEFGEVSGSELHTRQVEVVATGGSVGRISVSTAEPFGASASGCPPVLEAEQSCTVEVTVFSSSPGEYSGSLAVASTAGTVTAPLTAVVVARGPTTTTTETTTTTSTALVAGDLPTDSSTPDGGSALDEDEADCEDRARRARVIYRPTERMTVDESTSVEVVAFAPGGTAGTLTTTQGQATVVQPLRCQVRARLLGNDFTISPDDWTEKSFRDVQQVTWIWSVTPKKEGSLELTFEIQGLRRNPSGDFEPAGPEFQTQATITVEAQPQSAWSRLNDLISGFVTHPLVAFIGSAGLIAAVAWAVRRIRERAGDGGTDAASSDRDESSAAL